MARRKLEISESLALPAVETTTQTLVIYGGKGMGKTNLAAVIAEELAKAGQRFSVLDPVGVSWGLRYARDGKGEGLKVLILGGIHADLPIEPTGGAVVADFVADEEVNVVIDISRRADGRMWSNGEKIKFVTDYCTRLYERQGERRRPMMQLIDEAGRFVPQQIPRGAENIAACVGAIEQLVELGRNVGVGVTLITQRSARMNKSVSELAECMIAFRTVGPRSVDAILEWFGEHVPKARWNELIEQLRTLNRGQALIVSPGWLEFEGVAQIRPRETFDSSSTPTAAEKKMTRRASKIPNLDAYRERIAQTVEKAEASDPSKLRAKNATLERDLRQAREQLEAAKAKPAAAVKAAPALTDGDRAQLENLATQYEMSRLALGDAVDRVLAHSLKQHEALELSLRATLQSVREGMREDLERKRLLKAAERLAGVLEQLEAPAPKAPAAAPSSRPSAPAKPRKPIALDGESRILTPAGELKRHARAILTVLAQNPDGRNRTQIHLLAGYQPSGDTSVAFAEMIGRGWIAEAGKGLTITAAGLSALGPFDPLPTGAELRRFILEGSKLSSAERKILKAAFDAHENGEGGVTRARLHELAGLKPSGDTSVAFSKFLKLGWLEEANGGGLIASGLFFD